MTSPLSFKLVDNIKCYSLDEPQDYADYPEEGFDLTSKLEKESFWVRSRNRLLKSLIYKYSQHFTEPSFLEIGCGNAGFLAEIAQHKRLKIVGSEKYLKGLLFAKKKLPGVEFIQFDVNQGILPEAFNLIGAFDVLEHIDDDIMSISNIYRMLSKDGYLILTVPQYMFLWSRLDEIVKHKRRYSKQELLLKLRAGGFDICYCSSFVFLLFPFMLFSRMLMKLKKPSGSDKSDFENEVSFPKVLNWVFDKFMRFDEWLIECGMALPFGGSLLVVARKKA